MIVSSGERRGLLLPQVAVEHNLDREKFLSETCRKAHFLRDAWRDARTQILGFTCDVFSDAESAAGPETVARVFGTTPPRKTKTRATFHRAGPTFVSLIRLLESIRVPRNLPCTPLRVRR